MNDQYRAIALLLGFYILLQPAMMVWHAGEHEFEHTYKNNVKDVFVAAENSSDCEICTFYFDQSVIIAPTITYNFNAISIVFEEGLITSLYTSLSLQNHLRGPPHIKI